MKLPDNFQMREHSWRAGFIICYETGTAMNARALWNRHAMNARASENYLAIARSASKSVEIFWAEIYWGRLFFRAESSLIQSSCRSFIGVIVPYEILTST